MIKNQHGFSLTQVMVALGISGMTALMLFNIQKDSSKIQERMEIAVDVEMATKQIQGYLARTDDCTATLKGANPLFTPNIPSIKRTKFNSDPLVNRDVVMDLFKVPWAIDKSNNLYLTQIVLTKKRNVKNEIIGDALKLTFSRGDLKNRFHIFDYVDTTRFEALLGGNKIIERYIDVYGILDATGAYDRCYSQQGDSLSDDAEKKACLSVGGNYLATRNPKCILDSIPACIITESLSDGSECGMPGESIYPIAVNKIRTFTGIAQFSPKIVYQTPGSLTQCCRSGYQGASPLALSPTGTSPVPPPLSNNPPPPAPGGTPGGTPGGGTPSGSGSGSGSGATAGTDVGTTDVGCFVAGTQISLPGGEKKSIEDVMVGDELLDGNRNLVRVEGLKRYPYKGLVYSINGGEYFFTPNHPFLTLSKDHKRVWKSLDPKKSMEESRIEVSMMQVGDLLVKENGLEMLYTLDAISYEGEVYNFTVTPSHEYVANEYVVHNLKRDDHGRTTN